jgi:polyisoprenoid-binding protein YceI
LTQIRRFNIDPERSTVSVRAQSRLHGVKSLGAGLNGYVAGNFDDPRSLAEGRISFPMAQMSFGDRIRDFALRRQLNIKRWPQAHFDVQRVEVQERDPWRIQVIGVLSYHDHTLEINLPASGSVSDTQMNATAQFTINLPDIGITPPRFLMFKMANTVTVEVRLYASQGEC